jgi:predicted CXXCH cytochrome family protein
MKITSVAKIAGGLTLLAASSVAMASVSNTKHNLSSNSSGAHIAGGASTEICIFCHTPHGGDQSVAAPIWNRQVSSTSVYTRFSNMGRITFDAKEAPVGSVSIACLSCHDGTQARDAVINSPGSDSTGWVVGSGPTAWSDGTNTATGYLSDLNASDNGTMGGDMIYLGTDLRNDHPISMQYGGGNLSTTTPTAVTKDPDFAKAATSGTGSYGSTAPNNAQVGTTAGAPGVTPGIATGLVVYTANYNGNAGPKWYIDTGTPGYQGTDFPLYTRTDLPGDSTAQPFVECATCHDPHSGNSTFLRLPGGNRGSQVCLTCHAK